MYCKQCDSDKHQDEFRASCSSKCRDCLCEYDRNRNKEPGRYAAIRAWDKNNPIKRKATKTVEIALYHGDIHNPGICESCSNRGTVVAHHDDYSKQLDIRWLCNSCHRLWHVKNGEGING